MSIAPRPARNPRWLSGRWPCSRGFSKRFKRTRVKIFPAIERREIALWLLHNLFFPFLLYMCTMITSLNSCESVSFCQWNWNKSVSFLKSKEPPALNTSAGVASEPGAIPTDNFLMALVISSTDGMASSSLFIVTLGRRWIASSLIFNDRLRTLLKY